MNVKVIEKKEDQTEKMTTETQTEADDRKKKVIAAMTEDKKLLIANYTFEEGRENNQLLKEALS